MVSEKHWTETTEERGVELRRQELEAYHDFDETTARVLAWSELGYSSNAIARKLDFGKSAVLTRLDDVEDQFGIEAVFTKIPEDRDGPLE